MEERDNSVNNNTRADVFSDCQLESSESNNGNDTGSDAIQTEEYRNNKKQTKCLITEMNLSRGRGIYFEVSRTCK